MKNYRPCFSFASLEEGTVGIENNLTMAAVILN